MRGLWKAALLLVPLASAFVLPDKAGNVDDRVVVDEQDQSKPAVAMSVTDVVAPASELPEPSVIHISTRPWLTGPDSKVWDTAHKVSDSTPEAEDETVPFELEIEAELFELQVMREQLLELKYQIREREALLSSYITDGMATRLSHCESMKCAALAIYHKVKGVAHHVISKATHHHHGKGHFPHGPHGGNRGNCSREGKGNHAHPHPDHPPHWRKPLANRPLPLCHCLPVHGGGRHHPAPHHGSRKGPDMSHDHIGHSLPEKQHASDGQQDSTPDNDTPPQPLDDSDNHISTRPHHGEQYPTGSSRHRGSKGAEYVYVDFSPHHPGSREHRHPSDRHHRPHNPLFRLAHIFGLIATGALLILLFTALRRRWCNSSRRALRQCKRDERHRRRAYRRAAKKLAWKQWFASLVSSSVQTEEEEKREMLDEASSGNSDEMASEISEFRNAVDVVEDIVAAEEGRGRLSMGSLPEYMSELGEELPEYQVSDGTEASSFIADGFRYTPGTSDYTPSISSADAGSVRNVLGDTKD